MKSLLAGFEAKDIEHKRAIVARLVELKLVVPDKNEAMFLPPLLNKPFIQLWTDIDISTKIHSLTHNHKYWDKEDEYIFPHATLDQLYDEEFIKKLRKNYKGSKVHTEQGYLVDVTEESVVFDKFTLTRKDLLKIVEEMKNLGCE